MPRAEFGFTVQAILGLVENGALSQQLGYRFDMCLLQPAKNATRPAGNPGGLAGPEAGPLKAVTRL